MWNDYRQLPEWLQREADDASVAEARKVARERLWIGLAIMFLVVVAVLAANAWLGTQGFGA
jgi:hypothetical protein